MNIKLLTLGPQNFYHTSMVTPEAKHKTPKPKSQISCWLNSETPIEEVPLLSPCTTTPPPTTPTTPMLSKTSGYIATRDTKLLPHLMLQWNYEHKTFDNSTTKLLPDLNVDPRNNTQNLKPKSQI